MDLATSSRPRFRTDLVAEVMEAEGQRFIDVIDPDTGDAFRFYEVEYSIACAMDGERDHLPLQVGVGLVVDVLEVGRLPAQAGPVVDDLAVDLARRVVDERHGWCS